MFDKMVDHIIFVVMTLGHVYLLLQLMNIHSIKKVIVFLVNPAHFIKELILFGL
jgi:uncharacterized protein YqhQ